MNNGGECILVRAVCQFPASITYREDNLDRNDGECLLYKTKDVSAGIQHNYFSVWKRDGSFGKSSNNISVVMVDQAPLVVSKMRRDVEDLMKVAFHVESPK